MLKKMLGLDWRYVLITLALLLGAGLSAGIALAGAPSYGNYAPPSSKVAPANSQPPLRSAERIPMSKMDAPARSPLQPRGTISDEVLYNQYSALHYALITSQDFESTYDNYDSQAADDFRVPNGETWAVTAVEVAGAYSQGGGPASSVNVFFYATTGQLPGTPVFTQTGIIPSAGLESGDFYIPLSPPATLPSGSYWVSVQANQEISLYGQWFWRERQFQAGAYSAWRNPGGGFERTNCLDWGNRVFDCAISSEAPDQVFRLVGKRLAVATVTVTKSPSSPSPTNTVPPTVTGTPPTATATRTRSVPTPVLTGIVPFTPSPAATSTPPPACGLHWRVVPSPLASAVLNSVSAASATDVWAVGETGGSSQTVILRWDGVAWNVVPSPNPSQLYNNLFGVSVLSPNDAWAVGSYYMDGAFRPLTLHWDGSQWSLVPTAVLSGSVFLYSVDVIAANDVWAVGQRIIEASNVRSLALHWDGTSWSEVPTPVVTNIDVLRGVSSISSNDVWAVGQTVEANLSSALALHWDGTSWSAVTVYSNDFESGLYSVSARAANDVWAVGFRSPDGFDYLTLAVRWDGTSWVNVPTPNNGPYFNWLASVSALAANEAWAVGYYADPDVGASQTLHMRWDGTAWVYSPSPSPGSTLNRVQGVAAVSASDVWSVGTWEDSNALIERYNDPCAPPTNTPTATSTGTAVPTATSTSTGTSTATDTSTPTATSSGTATDTPAATNTSVATPTACTISFADVPTTNTFYAYIRCLACRGILGGYADGTFRPNNDITRGQLSKVVANSAGFTEPVSTQSFEDVPPGSTFYEYVERMARRGIIGGYACGNPEPCVPPLNRPYFRPNTNTTRGQISKIVSEAAGYSNPVSGQTFEDVPPGSTFYLWIERLAGRGIMGGYGCGNPEPCVPPLNRPYFRPNNNATRGQVSKIVANTFFPECSP